MVPDELDGVARVILLGAMRPRNVRASPSSQEDLWMGANADGKGRVGPRGFATV
jgi:hypothetical protein